MTYPAPRRLARDTHHKMIAGVCAGIAALLLYWRGPLDFFGLPAVIAAVVYLVDVRPAVRGLRRGNTSW